MKQILLLMLLLAAASIMSCSTAGDGDPAVDIPELVGAEVMSDAAADTTASFEPGHSIYEHTEAAGKTGLATGDFENPAFSYPPIDVPEGFVHQLNFMMTPFAPPYRRQMATHGPLVVFNDQLDVIVFSAMDNFFVSVVEFRDGKIHYGVAGEVDGLPADFEHRFILVKENGINAAFEEWGRLLRQDRGKERVDLYADPGLSYLGYWTDNGAFYYYNTEEGKNEEDTLLAVKADADANNIPYGYMQLDSWWYFKDGTAGLWPPAGLIEWEPRPEVFPDGLEAFQAKLGLPLIAHNRWFNSENAYSNDYEFIIEDIMAIPTGQGVFDEFMDNALKWGVFTYEQDWLVTQYWGLSWLRNHPDHAPQWMANMDNAAHAKGLTMQLCMPDAAHIMDSVDRRASTTTRTSTDYSPGKSKESYWPEFHTVNMLAWAVGLPPFKDNFQTAEAHAEAEALVSALSAGMVGIGDAIGAMDREIIMRTCREDGLLLKPDRPATPIDAMFLPHKRPHTTMTWSDREELGRTMYVAAYHLAEEHPERTEMDRAWALVNYDAKPMNDIFVFPQEVTDWTVDLISDLGIEGPVVVYNWRTGNAEVVEGTFQIPVMEHLYDWSHFVVAPIQESGFALIGDKSKYATLADRRFSGVTVTPTELKLQVVGVEGETIELLVFDTQSGDFHPGLQVEIGKSGAAGVTVSR